jgi:spore photoproduct lyase
MMKENLKYRDGKNEMQVVTKQGEAMGVCATFNRKYICCNVHVLRSVHNCPFECSYCFLQNYLTDGMTKSVGDVDELIDEVRQKVERESGRLFRIGTWELGDSLAWEGRIGQAAKLVREFSVLENAVLELKTKSDRVDSLLNINHKGRTVVSWSLNTDHIIRAEEHKTATLEARLEAIGKIVNAGYLIGMHFDPMILHEGWEEGYRELVRKVFEVADPGRIAWISIGSLRFNPEMKKKIENNYPDSRLTLAEMVLGDDAKMRYVKPLRVEMYRLLYNELKNYINDNNLAYLCMERWDVWDKVLGYHPDSVEHLDYLFAKSLYDRYGIGPKSPEREYYEKGMKDGK